MTLREVRVREWGNRLVFRYDPVANVIELVERRQRVVIALDEYRPAHLRRRRDEQVGVNFARIEDSEAD